MPKPSEDAEVDEIHIGLIVAVSKLHAEIERPPTRNAVKGWETVLCEISKSAAALSVAIEGLVVAPLLVTFIAL